MIKESQKILTLIIILVVAVKPFRIQLSNKTWKTIPSFPFIGNRNKTIHPFIAPLNVIDPTLSQLDSCDQLSPNTFNRSIVLYIYGGGCSIEKHVQIIEQAGGIAAIQLGGGWSECNYYDQDSSTFNNSIPLLCFDGITFGQEVLSLFAQNTPTWIDFTPQPNPLSQLDQSAAVIVSILHILLNIVIILLCFIKTFLLIRSQGLRLNFAILAYSFSFLGAIFSIMFYVSLLSLFTHKVSWQYFLATSNLARLFPINSVSLISCNFALILIDVYKLATCYKYLAITLITLAAIIYNTSVFAVWILYSIYQSNSSLQITFFTIQTATTCPNLLLFYIGSILLINKIRQLGLTPNNDMAKNKTKYTQLVIGTILVGLAATINLSVLGILTTNIVITSVHIGYSLVVLSGTCTIFITFTILFIYKVDKKPLHPHKIELTTKITTAKSNN